MGGRETGFGHVARMIPIYDAFERASISCCFFIKGDGGLEGILEGRKAVTTNWVESFDPDGFGAEDIILIDTLEPPVEFIDRAEKRTQKVYFISDSIDTPNYPFRVINWRVGPVSGDKQNGLYGESYVPLRDAVTATKREAAKGDKLQVVLSMGGSDVLNLIPFTLELFVMKFQMEIHFKAIIRSFHPEYDQLKRRYANQVEFLTDMPADQLFPAISDCDFAIASGGHSIYEFAYLGIPVIHVLVADNQEPAKCWDPTGFTIPVGKFDPVTYSRKTEAGIRHFLVPQNRQKASRRGKELIDGKGADRIFEALMKGSA